MKDIASPLFDILGRCARHRHIAKYSDTTRSLYARIARVVILEGLKHWAISLRTVEGGHGFHPDH
jgi:hypothetical protein